MSKASLRPATSADHALYAHFFAQLGTEDPPLEPARFEREGAPSTAFLMDGERALGYAAWELAGLDVHVRHVVVDTPARGRGFGRQLMRALARLFRERGAQAWRLNVHSSNQAALGLYASLGFRAIYATVVVRLEWDHVARLPELPAQACEAEPAFDAAIEADFGLLKGQLGRARGKQGVRIVSSMGSKAECLGLAVFDPSFPGAFPFRCKAPEYARGLIEWLRERYDGASSFVQIVIEDAAPVVRAMETAGAQRIRDIVHMRGVIPHEPAR